MFNQNDYVDMALGSGVGLATYVGGKKLASQYVAKPYGKFAMKSLTEGFNQSEIDVFKTAAQQAYENTGLKSHGVVFNNVTPENVNKLNAQLNNKCSKIIEKIMRKVGYNEKAIEKFKLKQMAKKDEKMFKALKITANGKNAFFHPFGKSVNVNLDKMPAASFHEMGHALNHSGKYTKILAWGRHPLALLVPVILGVGLLKNKKQEGQEPTGKLDKIGDFIKNNAGKLSFAAMIPTLAEEGLASIRGSKMAKPLLSKEMFKKLNIAHTKAWGTYLLGAVITSLMVRLAVTARDRVVANGVNNKNIVES